MNNKTLEVECPYCKNIIELESPIYDIIDGITRTIYCDKCEKILLLRNKKILN